MSFVIILKVKILFIGIIFLGFQMFKLTTDKHNSDESDEGIRFSENEEEEYRSRFDTEFQYVSTIGHGAYGVVYKATHRIDLTTYAVKRITVPKRYHIYALGSLC